ncbi:hypothetical protein ACFYT4_22145 [Streptomyces sp. NPDC004609]|uniref:hypothetical protein n=1 Tax=Streptomyces sp. NPDC004609 TaxID=3364704 RepID=UPI0036843926
MRHTLARVLCLHRRTHRPPVTGPEVPRVRVNPWSRPWAGPTKEEARAILRQRAAHGRPRKLYIAPYGVHLRPGEAG